MARLLALVLTLVPALAWAAPSFIAGNDLGVTNTATQYWSAIQASPNLASTVVDSTTGNVNSIEISAASGAAEYVAETISSASTISASVRFYVPTATTLPSVRRKVLSFFDTGASKTGCMVTMEADSADSSKYRLRAFYESADASCDATGASCPSGGECASSLTQDGKECTSRTDCDYFNSGEQSCAPGSFASTLALAKATWFLVTLQQVNGTGEVTCSLWQGTAGTSPVVYQRGSQTHDQGICVGGANAGNACDDNTDCASNNCTTTDVVTIEQVRFGTDDTEAGAITYNLDDMVIDTGTPNQNYRLQTLVPTSDGTNIQLTVNGCTSGSAEWDCINDAAPDDDTSYVTSSTDGEIQQANVTDITLAGGESVLAVAATALVRSAGSSSPMFDGLTTTDGTSKSASFDTNTVGTTYHLMPPYVLTDPPGSPTSWTETLVDGIQFYAEIGVGGGQIRLTSARVEVLIDQSDPSVPTVIPDRNQDGEDTVCLVGDSTFNDPELHDIVAGGLPEATNLIECARGGATAGDVTDTMSVAGINNDILDGGSSQYMSCRALKGSLKTCDVVILEIGVNTLRTSVTADPTNGTNEHGSNVPGVCDSKGGANDQGACTCPHGTDSRRSNTTNHYCRTKGADWLTTCTGAAECACSVDADCCADCPNGACATCTTSQGVCTGGVCTCTGLGCLDCRLTATAANWHSDCVAGCLDSPQCPSGLCMAHESTVDLMDEIRSIETLRAARPTPNPAATPSGTSGKPIIIYSFPPPGNIKNGLDCWQDMEPSIGNYRTALLAFAKTNSLPFLDMYGRFQKCCPGGSIRECLRDNIHWDTDGETCAGLLALSCLTNEGSVTTDGVCDTVTTHLCTGGKVNDPCSANADCATWSCNLLAAP
jgi:hypothetical protein